LAAGLFPAIPEFRIPGIDVDHGFGRIQIRGNRRFPRGILHREVKGSLKANPIPAWAQAQVIEAWNVPRYVPLTNRGHFNFLNIPDP
jgi:hypothetical protein